MARVPSAPNLSNVQRSLIPQPTNVVRATPGAFGAQIGRAQAEAGASLAGAGQQLAQIAIEMQHESNQRELKGADNAQSELEHTIWSGDGTAANPGFGNLEGQFAVDAQADTERVRQKGMEAIRKGLSSDFLRARWDEMSSQRSSAARARSSDHVVKQSKVANARQADTRMALAIRDAASDFNNPTRMNDHFAAAGAEANTAAWNRGIRDQKQLDLASDIARSKVARSAIEGAIANDDVALAKDLLKSYSSPFSKDNPGGQRIFDDDLIAMKKALKTGTARVVSQEIADGIFLLHPDDPEARLKAARAVKHKDPAVRDATLDRVTKFNAEQARATREAASGAYLEAGSRVEAGEAVVNLPAEITDHLTVGQKNTLIERERQVASGVPVHSVSGVLRKASLLPRSQKARLDLPKYKTLLSPHDYALLESQTMQARIEESRPLSKSTTVSNPFTLTQKFNTRIKDAGREFTDEEWGALNRQYQEQVQIETNRKKSAVTNDEVDVILDSLFDKVIIRRAAGFGIGSVQPSGGVLGIDIERLRGEVEVPTELRPRLIRSFQTRNNRAPSELELVDEYVALLESADE